MRLNAIKVATQLWEDIPIEHRKLLKRWGEKLKQNKDKRIKIDMSVSENKIIYRCAKCNWEGKSKRGVISHRNNKRCPPPLYINFKKVLNASNSHNKTTKKSTS